jgi:hypothetical protein
MRPRRSCSAGVTGRHEGQHRQPEAKTDANRRLPFLCTRTGELGNAKVQGERVRAEALRDQALSETEKAGWREAGELLGTLHAVYLHKIVDVAEERDQLQLGVESSRLLNQADEESRQSSPRR